MRGFEDLGKKLEQSGRAEKLMELADTPEGKKVCSMVDPKQVTEAVKNNDDAALQSILRQVLGTAEGRKLAEKLSDAMK